MSAAPRAAASIHVLDGRRRPDGVRIGDEFLMRNAGSVERIPAGLPRPQDEAGRPARGIAAPPSDAADDRGR